MCLLEPGKSQGMFDVPEVLVAERVPESYFLSCEKMHAKAVLKLMSYLFSSPSVAGALE